MKDLEVLSTNSALYGAQLEKQNRNNVFLNSRITSLESQLAHFKGYYNSVKSLNIYCPEKEEGDFAYVKRSLYCVESLKWIDSGLTIDDFNYQAQYQPYAFIPTPVYYRGDSVLVDLGPTSAFENAKNIKANVFVSSAFIVKAALNPNEGEIQIRRDNITEKYYFIIPRATTEKMQLGQQTLELAAYFRAAFEGEEFVKRSRKFIFELQEFETL